MKELVTNIILYHIADHFTPSPLGRPNCEPKIVLEYVLLVLQSGMAWRHLQQTRCPYDYRTRHQKPTHQKLAAAASALVDHAWEEKEAEMKRAKI